MRVIRHFATGLEGEGSGPARGWGEEDLSQGETSPVICWIKV